MMETKERAVMGHHQDLLLLPVCHVCRQTYGSWIGLLGYLQIYQFTCDLWLPYLLVDSHPCIEGWLPPPPNQLAKCSSSTFSPIWDGSQVKWLDLWPYFGPQHSKMWGKFLSAMYVGVRWRLQHTYGVCWSLIFQTLEWHGMRMISADLSWLRSALGDAYEKEVGVSKAMHGVVTGAVQPGGCLGDGNNQVIWLQ